MKDAQFDLYDVTLTGQQLDTAMLEGVWLEEEIQNGWKVETLFKVMVNLDFRPDSDFECFEDGKKEVYVHMHHHDLTDTREKRISRYIYVYTTASLIKKFIRNPQTFVYAIEHGLSNDHGIKFIFQMEDV